MPQVHESAHRGIRIYWTELEGPLTGTLLFGVGMRDEQPHLAGITHLTEHMIFRALGPVIPDHDGTTSANILEFYVTGEPEEVVSVLNRISAIITNPKFTEDDLLREKLVIEAENPKGITPFRGLLTMRYGFNGIGKADAGDPTLPSITLDEISTWMHQHLTASNARMVFTGPPPEGLDVSLPEGPPQDHSIETEQISRPTLVENDEGITGLSLLIPAHHAPLLRDVIEQELRTALRTERALLYEIDTKTTAITAEHTQLDVLLDPSLEHPAEALGIALDTLRRAAQHGFRQASMDSAVASCRNAMRYPHAWASHADELAAASLHGHRALSPDECRTLADDLDALTAAAMIEAAWPTLIVTCEDEDDAMAKVAEDHGLALDAFTFWGSPAPEMPKKKAAWRGRGDLGLRDRAALIGDELWVRAFGTIGRLNLSEVVVVGEHSDGTLSMLGPDGRLSLLDPSDWWGGWILREVVLERVPASVRRDFSWHSVDGRPTAPPASAS